MEILNETIKVAGGVSALARHLGIRPNTVSNWQARGLPRAYALLFAVMRDSKTGVFAGHDPNVITNETKVKVIV